MIHDEKTTSTARPWRLKLIDWDFIRCSPSVEDIILNTRVWPESLAKLDWTLGTLVLYSTYLCRWPILSWFPSDPVKVMISEAMSQYRMAYFCTEPEAQSLCWRFRRGSQDEMMYSLHEVISYSFWIRTKIIFTAYLQDVVSNIQLFRQASKSRKVVNHQFGRANLASARIF